MFDASIASPFHIYFNDYIIVTYLHICVETIHEMLQAKLQYSYLFMHSVF